MGFFTKILSLFKRDVSVSSETIDSQEKPETVISNGSDADSTSNESEHINGSSPITEKERGADLTQTKKGISSEGDTPHKELDSNLPSNPSLPGSGFVPTDPSTDESYIDKIRREEEERKKREWLEFLRTKRAKRKKELEEELAIINKHLTYIQDRIQTIKEEKKSLVKKDGPNLNISSYNFTPLPTNQFIGRGFERIVSMHELLQQRIEEERRRIEEAERTTLVNIERAREAIQNRDLDGAKECLDIISKQTAFIENKDINVAIKDVVFAITELSNLLEAEKREQEELRRKAEALAAQQRAEALERQRQEEEARKLREEEARKERAMKYEEELRQKAKAQQDEMTRLNELSSSLKPDARDIVKFLRDNGIYYLYHFTEASNLPLIKSRKGLYSWSYLLSHSMKIPSPGGNDTSRGLDRDKGLEDFVRLSFCKSHPMAYRIHKESEGRANLVLLKIKIDVSMFESTLFSNINATDKRAIIGSDKDFLEENLDFEAISLDWCWGSDPRHKPRQAEVMVKTFIPSKYIVNLDNPDIMTFNN